MALYHQLKFPSTFIEYHSASEWKGVVVISNFDSLEAAPTRFHCTGTSVPCRKTYIFLQAFTIQRQIS